LLLLLLLLQGLSLHVHRAPATSPKCTKPKPTTKPTT
jgi:hypothetical protein